jgi:hypothetical protein
MKKSILLFAFLCFIFSHTASAQNKEGYTWVLGYPPDPCCPAWFIDGSMINFSDNTPDTAKFLALRSMFSSCSISEESDGNLLFYSNGCDLINRNNEIMEDGENVNNVDGYQLYCENGYKGYGELQDMIILPYPKHQGMYKSFHIRYPEAGQPVSEIRVSTVDMDKNNGLGAVIEKNIDLLDTYVVNGYMTAVRHGNGIDWWITIPEWRNTKKIVFLLDSLGVHGPDIQEKAGILTGSGGYGQAVFSPDGGKYAEICFFQGQLLDFDRCTGKFSRPQIIQFDTAYNERAGVAFSPDSRYLYVSRTDSIYQYDLSAADFNASRLTIASDEGLDYDSTGLKNAHFYSMLLGPDGKIYIGGPGVTKALHIIHHPNERGAACGFERWGLELPTLHYGQLPNLPNFKLGATAPPCSDCGAPGELGGAAIFPNPATDYVVVSGTGGEGNAPLVFQLYDALGRLLIEEELGCLPARVELGDLPDAGYFYRVLGAGGGRIDSGTLAKVRGR